jgi:homogentisate 1,2-dioxygenase
MPMYQIRGEVPPKRHTQLWRNGVLLREEVMGLEGFSGNESILYHLHTPCRVKELAGFEPLAREEWIPDNHAQRHFRTSGMEPEGDPVAGRRVLFWNDDVEISFCRPAEGEMGYFYRNGEGDEVVYVHEGAGAVETILGDLTYRPGDYVVIPRGITHRFRCQGPQRHLVFTSRSQIEIPRRYRNEYGQLLEHAPYYHRDIHPVGELRTHDEEGEFRVKVRVRGGFQSYVLDYHPFDVVGWDGYVYPWTFNVADFEPIAGRVHVPPPSHQTFEGEGFVICSFCPRKVDWDPRAVPAPYDHSNLNSDELMFFASEKYKARRGIEPGSITLHPSGIPHGPQPGMAEKSLGVTETEELAVMCDTFRPLRLSAAARGIDDPAYARSWYEPRPEAVRAGG